MASTHTKSREQVKAMETQKTKNTEKMKRQKSEKVARKEGPNSKKQTGRKSAISWEQEALKTKKPVIDEELEEFCLENDDCRAFRYNEKTGLATVKVNKENGQIYSVNTLPDLIALLEEKTTQKVFKCKICAKGGVDFYTTNIVRHLDDCHPIECQICQEMGETVLVPRSKIKEHCRTVHAERKSPSPCGHKHHGKHSHHKHEGGEKMVKCSVCDEKVPLKNIREHVQKEHPDHQRCKQCKGYVYVHKNEWYKHNKEMGHNKIKQFKAKDTSTIKCRRCHTYIAPEDLRNHNRNCR